MASTYPFTYSQMLHTQMSCSLSININSIFILPQKKKEKRKTGGEEEEELGVGGKS